MSSPTEYARKGSIVRKNGTPTRSTFGCGGGATVAATVGWAVAVGGAVVAARVAVAALRVAVAAAAGVVVFEMAVANTSAAVGVVRVTAGAPHCAAMVASAKNTDPR